MRTLHPAHPPGPAHEVAPSLALAGFLMVGAGLLLANPAFGVADTRWPWEILAREPYRINSVNWMIWFVTALLAIALGLSSTRRWRAPLLTGLALTLAFTCHSQTAGLVIGGNNLAFFAGTAALLAGFLLGAEDRLPRAARALTALGGLMVLWSLAASFRDLNSGRLGSMLLVLLRDLSQRVRTGVVEDAPQNYDEQLWSYGCVMVASAVGLLALVGVRGPLVSRLGLVLVVCYFLIPTFSGLGRDLSSSFQLDRAAARMTEVLIDTGFALALLAGAALADLARLGSPPPAPASAPADRWSGTVFGEVQG